MKVRWVYCNFWRFQDGAPSWYVEDEDPILSLLLHGGVIPDLLCHHTKTNWNVLFLKLQLNISGLCSPPWSETFDLVSSTRLQPLSRQLHLAFEVETLWRTFIPGTTMKWGRSPTSSFPPKTETALLSAFADSLEPETPSFKWTSSTLCLVRLILLTQMLIVHLGTRAPVSPSCPCFPGNRGRKFRQMFQLCCWVLVGNPIHLLSRCSPI